jgi:hypothetical protein
VKLQYPLLCAVFAGSSRSTSFGEENVGIWDVDDAPGGKGWGQERRTAVAFPNVLGPRNEGNRMAGDDALFHHASLAVISGNGG